MHVRVVSRILANRVAAGDDEPSLEFRNGGLNAAQVMNIGVLKNDDNQRVEHGLVVQNLPVAAQRRESTVCEAQRSPNEVERTNAVQSNMACSCRGVQKSRDFLPGHVYRLASSREKMYLLMSGLYAGKQYHTTSLETDMLKRHTYDMGEINREHSVAAASGRTANLVGPHRGVFQQTLR